MPSEYFVRATMGSRARWRSIALVTILLVAPTAWCGAQTAGPPSLASAQPAAAVPRTWAGPRLASRRSAPGGSAAARPFWLPRPGERTAFWAGLGIGVAISPLLWCEGSGCGAWEKGSTTLLLGLGGAVSGMLLARTF